MSDNTSRTSAPKSVQKLKLSELSDPDTPGENLLSESLQAIKDIKVQVTVAVGSAEMTVQNLYDLKDGEIISLDKSTTEPVDILVDGRVIARGDLVAVDDNFGVRISEITRA